MKFKYKTKTGEIDCELKYSDEGRFYTLYASKGETLMGFATFLFKNEYGIRKMWLQYIETKEKFAHQGVATAMINIMEYVSYKNHVDRVEGKYYPKNEYAKPFYEKNGYDIDHEYYDWYIDKRLEFNEVEKLKSNFVFEKTQDIENIL